MVLNNVHEEMTNNFAVIPSFNEHKNILLTFLIFILFYLLFFLSEDERNFQMNGFFKCRNETRFIILEKVCDNNFDCLTGNDELLCKWPEIDNITECIEISFSTIKCKFTKNKLFLYNQNIKNSKKLIIEGNYVENFLKTSYELLVLKIINFENYFHSSNYYFPNLIYLELNKTVVNEDTRILNQPMKKLRKLIFYKSHLRNLHFLKNLKCIYLEFLKIDYSEIIYLIMEDFKVIKNLSILHLTNSNIEFLDQNPFKYLAHLEFLSLFSSNFHKIKFVEILKNLEILKIFKSDHFELCCFCLKHLKLISICKPFSKKNHNCKNPLHTNVKKCLLWVITVIGIFENLYAIYYCSISFSRSKDFKIALFFSELLLFFYFLLFVAFSTFSDDFHLDLLLKDSLNPVCLLLNFLFQFSYTYSTLVSLLITLERYVAISKPMKLSIFRLHPRKFLLGNSLIPLFFLLIQLFSAAVI